MIDSKIYSYVLVTIQFSSLIVISLLNLHLFTNVFVVLCLFIGLGIGFSAIKINNDFNIIPEIKHNACLVTHGIYKYVRHPMYFSLLVAFFGFFIYGNLFTKLLYLLLFSVLFLKAKKEEKLWNEYDACYKEYKKNTKMIIPFLF